jgi:hypothetical protein
VAVWVEPAVRPAASAHPCRRLPHQLLDRVFAALLFFERQGDQPNLNSATLTIPKEEKWQAKLVRFGQVH